MQVRDSEPVGAGRARAGEDQRGLGWVQSRFGPGVPPALLQCGIKAGFGFGGQETKRKAGQRCLPGRGNRPLVGLCDPIPGWGGRIWLPCWQAGWLVGHQMGIRWLFPGTCS